MRQTTQQARCHPQRGLSLIELMIAMVLGLLIVLGLSSLFLSSKRNFRQDEMIGRMQEEARFGIDNLTRDLSMAGFWGEVIGTSTLGNYGGVVTNDCVSGGSSWIKTAQNSMPISALDNTTGASANTAFSCIASTEVAENTDIVAIKRVSGERASSGEAARVYMRNLNGTAGLLFMNDGTVGTLADNPDWEYRPAIYYIRNFSVTAGDGIPALCRKILSPDTSSSPPVVPAVITECLAQGVENLQVEYGLDTNITPDGVANRYVSAPLSAAQQNQVVTVRFYLLSRSVERDFGYISGKRFSFANFGTPTAYAPADNFYRRVYTTTVMLRNPIHLAPFN